jgi:hypothetical protein
MRFQRPSTERSAAFRSRALSFAKSCSIGLKSGEEASCNRRTVMRKVPYLLEAGYIQVFHYRSQGRALDYQVLFPGRIPLTSAPLRKKRR